jgi:hypothetical protein
LLFGTLELVRQSPSSRLWLLVDTKEKLIRSLVIDQGLDEAPSRAQRVFGYKELQGAMGMRHGTPYISINGNHIVTVIDESLPETIGQLFDSREILPLHQFDDPVSACSFAFT